MTRPLPGSLRATSSGTDSTAASSAGPWVALVGCALPPDPAPCPPRFARGMRRATGVDRLGAQELAPVQLPVRPGLARTGFLDQFAHPLRSPTPAPAPARPRRASGSPSPGVPSDRAAGRHPGADGTRTGPPAPAGGRPGVQGGATSRGRLLAGSEELAVEAKGDRQLAGLVRHHACRGVNPFPDDFLGRVGRQSCLWLSGQALGEFAVRPRHMARRGQPEPAAREELHEVAAASGHECATRSRGGFGDRQIPSP